MELTENRPAGIKTLNSDVNDQITLDLTRDPIQARSIKKQAHRLCLKKTVTYFARANSTQNHSKGNDATLHLASHIETQSETTLPGHIACSLCYQPASEPLLLGADLMDRLTALMDWKTNQVWTQVTVLSPLTTLSSPNVSCNAVIHEGYLSTASKCRVYSASDDTFSTLWGT